MEIGRTDGVCGPGGIDPRNIEPVRPPVAPAAGPVDRLDTIETSRLITDAASLPAVRADVIAEYKHLIDAGRYQTDERLMGAFERFLRENRDLR